MSVTGRPSQTLLGSTSDACDRLGVDLAELFYRVSMGWLVLERDSDDEPWRVYVPDGKGSS